MKSFVVVPNCAVCDEEREGIEMEIVQDRFEWRRQPHEEAGFKVERRTWYYIDWLADRNQLVGIERRFMRVRQVESRTWDVNARRLTEVML